jgi:hypothetical protein
LLNSGLPGIPGLIIPAGTPDEGPVGPNLPDLPILGGSGPPPVITFENPPPDGPAVPEPASWVTMIIGFLAIGTLLRRRPQPGAASNWRPGIT